jgi:cytochrome c5
MNPISAARLVAALAIFGMAALLATLAEAAAPTGTQQVQQLQGQIDALNRQLTQLKATSDPAAQQPSMQRHWSLMQDYMRSVRSMPGMYAPTCTDWVMMDSSLMGGEKTWSNIWGPDMSGCKWPGHGTPKDSMCGMPGGMSPTTYQSQMWPLMHRMSSQIAAVSKETDPKKREALMRQHYATTYRDMQSLRGMGWLWAVNTAASLPEKDSHGAQLVASVCAQCHSPPSPSLHTATEWTEVISRMRASLQHTAAAGGGVKVPGAAELDAISKYLAKHAAAP